MTRTTQPVRTINYDRHGRPVAQAARASHTLSASSMLFSLPFAMVVTVGSLVTGIVYVLGHM